MTTETFNRKRSLRRIVAAAVAGAVLTGAMLMPSAVSADPDELQRGKLVQLLAERYGEASVAAGIAENGGVVELLTNADGSTWTLLMTLPDGSTRVVASGESWISVAALPGQPI